MKNDNSAKTSSQPNITRMTKSNYQKALDYFGLDGKSSKQVAARFNFKPSYKIKRKSGLVEKKVVSPDNPNFNRRVEEYLINKWKDETKEYQGKYKYKFQIYDKTTKKVNTINRELSVKGTKDTLLLNALAEFERLKNKYNRESDADLSSFELNDEPYEKIAIEEGKGILVVNGSVQSTTSGGKRKVGKRGHKAIMKMKFAGNHLLLAGKENQEWDRKQGTCVFDYLYHRFNGQKGFKKELGPEYRKKQITREEAYEWLNDLFKSNEIDEQNPLEQGVSTQQLEKFCDYFNISMYAFDKDDELIEWYRPNVSTEYDDEEEETDEKKQRYKNALFFIYYNQHFNPIEDKAEKDKKKGIAANKANNNIKSNDIESYKVVQDEVKRKVIAPELEHYEAEQKKLEEKNYPISLGNKIAMDMLRENNWVLPTMKSNAIDVEENTIMRIKYDDKIMITEPIQTYDKNGCKVNNLVKKYLEEYCDREYQGETYITIMNEIWNSMYPFSIRDAPFNSKPNTEVLNALNADKVKYRTHLGLIKEEYLKYVEKDENGQRLISKMLKNGKAIATDISKCYSDCIYNQRENFIVFSGRETIEAFDGKPLTLGLYFVETDDMTLFHQSNWYSREIIFTARGERINFKITHQIRCLEPEWKWEKYEYDEEGKETSSIKLNNRNLFKNFCDSIIETTEMDENFDLTKLILNAMTGYLGKTHSKSKKAMLSTNLQDIWEDWLLPEVSENPDAKVFINTIQDGDDKLYLYGWETESELVSNCLPMYIQILDWANVALYDMIKAVGGECIYRKTDAIVSVGGKLPKENRYNPDEPYFTKTFGKYRIEPNAENFFYDTLANPYRAVETPRLMGDWNWYDFNDSSDWKFIIELALKYMGLLISGRAGTGKSFIIKKAIEEGIIPDDPKTRLAPTNRAARNINGTTIHKALAINNNGKTNYKSMMYYANKQFIIVDEISMISSNVWNYLTRLKQTYPHLIFILMGDYRQCPPIEDGKEIDYFNHSYSKFLTNCNRVELTKPQRYDLELWNWLENFYEQGEVGDELCKKKLTIDNILYRKNICYTNKTRKRINQDCMSYLISQKSYTPVCLPVDEKILKDNNYADTAYLYNGLPVMSVKNNCDMGIINSEEFWVKEVKSNESILVLYRDEDETEEIEVPFKEFHKNFVVNYASTTHKSQGATIEKGINIWDWWAMEQDRKLGYTAVSRAKKCEQVWIADDSKFEEYEEEFDYDFDEY